MDKPISVKLNYNNNVNAYGNKAKPAVSTPFFGANLNKEINSDVFCRSNAQTLGNIKTPIQRYDDIVEIHHFGDDPSGKAVRDNIRDKCFDECGLNDEKHMAKILEKAENAPKRKGHIQRYDDPVITHHFGDDPSGIDIRADMRNRYLNNCGLNDESFKVKKLNKPINKATSAVKESKYKDILEKKLNTKTNQYVQIFDNIQVMPDDNGVRGKNPLFGKNTKGISFRLKKLQNSGINTVIDLRSKGECSAKAMEAMDNLGVKYVNFPIHDKVWSASNLDDITNYIKTVNKNDFFVGCANGEARTDLAVCINYILNPKAKQVPNLYFGNVSTSRVCVKDNLTKIFSVIKKNPDVVKEWGWTNFKQFNDVAGERFLKLICSIK